MIDKVQKIREEVERLRKSYQIMYQELDGESPELMSVCAKRNLCQDVLMFIDSLQEEPVSEDLGGYINELSKQFPDVSFAKLSRIAIRVSRWQRNQDVKNKLPKVISRTDLDEYAYQCAYDMSNDWAIDNPTWHDLEDACKLGAKWQEKQDKSTIELAEDHAMLAGMNKMEEQIMKNLWKPADGDDLPEYEREVVVFTQDFPNDAGIMKVAIAHRPDPKGWDGKSIATGKIEHYTPKTYDKGGWNIPNVKYWLDIDLPKLEEDCNMSKAEETSTQSSNKRN